MVGLRFLLAPLLLAGLHPLHTTFTELVEQPGGRRVTIVVRAFSDDLTHRRARGRRDLVGMRKTASCSGYVRTHLSLRTAAGRLLSPGLGRPAGDR